MDHVRVSVVGSVNLDLVARLDRLPATGETSPATGFSRIPGGKGANQALAARRLGAAVSLIAAVGDDPEAATALRLLREGDVDLTRVRTVDSPTGVALICVDVAGETTIVVVPGANGHLAVDPADVRGADAVLAVLEVPDSAVAAAAQHAEGVFVLNAAPARPVDAAVLDRADLVVVNRTEYAAIDGLDRARSVVVTHGAEGAELLREGRLVASAAPPPVRAVDGTGAGDAFVAAMVVGMLEGRADAELLTRACAAGAWAATLPGAQPSLPFAADLEELL